MKNSILFIPKYGKGNGIGHLHRSISISQSLINSTIYVDELIEMLRGIKITTNPWKEKWKTVIFDRRETTLKELLSYEKLGPTVGISEDGEARKYAPYLIDLIEGGDNGANLSLFSTPPQKRTKINFPFKKILITFGGEDPADLTTKIIKQNALKNFDLTYVEGPLFSKKIKEKNVIRNEKSLNHIIVKNDLVITSYGLTCFEALSYDIPVILFNPTKYHKKLSEKYSLPEIGVKRINLKKLKHFLYSYDIIETASYWYNKIKSQKNNLADEIKSLKFTGSMHCPSCGRINKVIERQRDKTVYKCEKCNIIYSVNRDS